MKLITFTILFYILLPSTLFAQNPDYRMYNDRLNRYYQCDRIYVDTNECLTKNASGSFTKRKIIILQQWTGKLDSQGKKIYEGNRLSTTNLPETTVKFGSIRLPSNQVILTWYHQADDGRAYLFEDLSNYPIAQWSTILK